MGTGSFPGVKRPGRGADPHSILSAEVLNRIQLYFYPPLRALVPLKGEHLPFTYTALYPRRPPQSPPELWQIKISSMKKCMEFFRRYIYGIKTNWCLISTGETLSVEFYKNFSKT
jgi:hypothetical protein